MTRVGGGLQFRPRGVVFRTDASRSRWSCDGQCIGLQGAVYVSENVSSLAAGTIAPLLSSTEREMNSHEDRPSWFMECELGAEVKAQCKVSQGLPRSTGKTGKSHKQMVVPQSRKGAFTLDAAQFFCSDKITYKVHAKMQISRHWRGRREKRTCERTIRLLLLLKV